MIMSIPLVIMTDNHINNDLNLNQIESQFSYFISLGEHTLVYCKEEVKTRIPFRLD